MRIPSIIRTCYGSYSQSLLGSVILSLQMSPGSPIQQIWMHRLPAVFTVKFETTAGEVALEVQRDWAPPFFGEGKNLLRPTRLAKICDRHLDLDAMRRAHCFAVS